MLHPISPDVSSAAQASMRKYRVPASVSLAQWIVESGWGVHSPGNNPFGMKPRHGMNDPSQELMTTEVIKGKVIHELQPFRVFPSIGAAFDAHAILLSTAPVYAPAMKVLPLNACPTQDTIDKFIDLMAGHYATDPLYASKLKAMISSQNLQRFDNE